MTSLPHLQSADFTAGWMKLAEGCLLFAPMDVALTVIGCLLLFPCLKCVVYQWATSKPLSAVRTVA